MTVTDLGRHVFCICVAATLLAGCGGSQVRLPVPGAEAVRGGASTFVRATGNPHAVEKALYSFGSRAGDGLEPYAGLIAVNGTLYGTTELGGTEGSCGGSTACGTVFNITRAGIEKTLHSFGANTDGADPESGLIAVKGTLYGTTPSVGSSGYQSGTVFSISKVGTEKVLHTFGSGTDGDVPAAGLLDVNGALYGTTVFGGKHGIGTVFRISTSGKEKVLYSFGSQSGDGTNPSASLIDVNGTLYGTTSNGGTGSCEFGCGTVFSISKSGTEKALYSFGSQAGDGYYPSASLIDVNSTLYGTTTEGGEYNCFYVYRRGFTGCGTVFSISTAGTEKVLHAFVGTDGAEPSGGLVDVKGTLYGTTDSDGAPGCYKNLGCGTVYGISTTGKNKLLYSFSGSDGAYPYGSLIDVHGTLYGTTSGGGEYGYGTVFTLTP